MDIEKLSTGATSTYRFLVLLSQNPILYSFVFRQGVLTSYAMADMFTGKERMEMFYKALIMHSDCTRDIAPIVELISPSDELKDTVKDAFRKGDCDKLIEICSGTLPEVQRMCQAREAFCVGKQLQDPSRISEWSQHVENKLRDAYAYDPQFVERETLSVHNQNCFNALGFCSLFLNWMSDQLGHDYDNVFFRWYCKGEVLDYVFDTITRCGNTSVSRSLFRLLRNVAKNDPTLSEHVQHRFDEYRLYYNVPDFKFESYSLPDYDEDMVEPLGELEGVNVYSLYTNLITNNIIKPENCWAERFTKLFVSTENGERVRPVTMNFDNQKQLNAFVRLTYNHMKVKGDKEDFLRRARNAIVCDNGNKFITLSRNPFRTESTEPNDLIAFSYMFGIDPDQLAV